MRNKREEKKGEEEEKIRISNNYNNINHNYYSVRSCYNSAF